MKNIHADHRERMRSKYEKFGENVFETHQLLEMMLFSFIPVKDTNDTAHGVLEKLKNESIFSVRGKELKSVPGVGDKVSDGLKMSSETVRRLICDGIERDGLDNDFKMRMYIYLRMLGRPFESVFLTTLSPKKRVLDFCEVTSKVRMTDNFIEFIISNAKSLGGTQVVLCHSHGKNTAEPSVEDLYLTALIKKRMEGSGVELTEHYIVTDTDCVPCSERTLR